MGLPKIQFLNSPFVLINLYFLFQHFIDNIILGEPNRLLSSFSVTSNFKEILKTTKNPNRIACLDGLRVFSMLWIIMGHRYNYSAILAFVNFDDVEKVCMNNIQKIN